MRKAVSPSQPSRARGGGAKAWVLMPAVRRGYEAEVFLGLRAGFAAAPKVDLAWCFDADDLLARRQHAGGTGVCVIIGQWPRATLRRLAMLPCAIADFTHHYATTGGAEPLPSNWHAYAPDDVEIGRMVARHFAERRLRALACLNPYPKKTSLWAALRIQGFCSEAGETCVAKLSMSAQRPETISRWLARLPKPTGLFCVTDKESAQAAEHCRQDGLAVPDQVAIAGVNNDPVWVDSASPALTSVMLPAYEIGLALAKAAGVRLRRGRWPLDEAPLLSPQTLLARASTDTLAVKEPRVLAAMMFIRARKGLGIGVEDVCTAVGVNRRSLELLFRKHLGHPPYAALRGARLEKAHELVAHSAIPITEIASLCHLPIDRFGRLFRKRYGLPPLALRIASRRP